VGVDVGGEALLVGNEALSGALLTVKLSKRTSDPVVDGKTMTPTCSIFPDVPSALAVIEAGSTELRTNLPSTHIEMTPEPPALPDLPEVHSAPM
jgi:hypothetical protein